MYATTGPYVEKSFTVLRLGGLIGRSRKCPVSLLHDCEVSHNHAVVERHGFAPGFCIRDIGSTFGTFLNDVRLSAPKRASESYKLKPGDTVKVGQTTLRWQSRQHLDEAGSIFMIAPPPVDPVPSLSPIGVVLARDHAALCNAAAPVELAVVGRRLELLAHVQARATTTLMDRSAKGADDEDWKRLLLAECESLGRDVASALNSQRDALAKLLLAQRQVYKDVRSCVDAEAWGEELAANPFNPHIGWLECATAHARWGYAVIRRAQLWLDALSIGAAASSQPEVPPTEAADQRARMLRGEARTLASNLAECLDLDGLGEVNAADCVAARQSLAAMEWELISHFRDNPTLSDNSRSGALRLPDAGALNDLWSIDDVLLFLPWSTRCYARLSLGTTEGAEDARGHVGYGTVCALGDATHLVQVCSFAEGERTQLEKALCSFALRQARHHAGTQHVARIQAMWEEGGCLYVQLPFVGGPVEGVTDGASRGMPPGLLRTMEVAAPGAWRRLLADVAAGLAALHESGLCAAGFTEADVALSAGGGADGATHGAVLTSLGLAPLGSAGRLPPGDTGGSWDVLVSIAPEAHQYPAADAMAVDGAVDGTEWPMAPCSAAGDIWSLGVLLWRVVVGPDVSPIVDFLRMGPHERPAHPAVPLAGGVPADAVALLQAMLQRDPERRPGAGHFLTHPFIVLSPRAVPLGIASVHSRGESSGLWTTPSTTRAEEGVHRLRRRLGELRLAARSALADDASAAPTISLRGGSLCEDLLKAAGRLPDHEWFGTCAFSLVPGGPGPAPLAPAAVVSGERAFFIFWQELLGDPSAPLHRALFAQGVGQTLGVASPPNSADQLPADRARAFESVRGVLGPGALILAPDVDPALAASLGRVVVKALVDGLPLPTHRLSASFYRALAGMPRASAEDLAAVQPLLDLQYAALLASGTTDGWMLDREQVGDEPGDVLQQDKARWIEAKIRADLVDSRAEANAGLASALDTSLVAASGVKAAVSLLPIESLMLAAAGERPPSSTELIKALRFGGFHEGSSVPDTLRRVVRSVTGMPPWRARSLPTRRSCGWRARGPVDSLLPASLRLQARSSGG